MTPRIAEGKHLVIAFSLLAFTLTVGGLLLASISLGSNLCQYGDRRSALTMAAMRIRNTFLRLRGKPVPAPYVRISGLNLQQRISVVPGELSVGGEGAPDDKLMALIAWAHQNRSATAHLEREIWRIEDDLVQRVQTMAAESDRQLQSTARDLAVGDASIQAFGLLFALIGAILSLVAAVIGVAG